MPRIISRSLGILLLVATITVPSCLAFYSDPGPLKSGTAVDAPEAANG